MGWMSDVLQGIPLNAVLKERVALAEQKFKDLESENKAMKARLTALEVENATLKEHIAQVPVATILTREAPEIVNGLYYFNGDRNNVYCPRCYEVEGKKHVMANMRHLGHRCTVCRNHIMR